MSEVKSHSLMSGFKKIIVCLFGEDLAPGEMEGAGK